MPVWLLPLAEMGLDAVFVASASLTVRILIVSIRMVRAELSGSQKN
jgi:hypothetical protein